MPSKAVIIPIIFLVLIIGAGISETFQGEGYFSAFHDGVAQDRAEASGKIEYAAVSHDSGLSSGLNVTGTGDYNFVALDYMISLTDYNGSIKAETDQQGTIVDGFGSGRVETRSYAPGGLVRTFPIGGMNSKGTFEIHARTAPYRLDDAEMNISEDTDRLRNLI